METSRVIGALRRSQDIIFERRGTAVARLHGEQLTSLLAVGYEGRSLLFIFLHQGPLVVRSGV